MNVTIEHPTNRSNFTIVYLGADFRIAFSYQTAIGLYRTGHGWLVADNQWGPTTGKHLNYLDNGDRGNRVPVGEIAKLIEAATK